ncbi:helix-turn-helix domain-containing protein [Streptomyces pseudovenezuelae]|uniref:Transcriptional regulator with XRE-family HTH domain n=1 Tax=Streptomyces pseudovenezuelae TaxID=67350 RepID=A0ABT6LDG3_9ACTN|nr:helix-turn-helix transcriptional regulator [Streptomyces pseudovenezuelae]MDH6214353.1 transcriptional regulator with XRE-family HTH domain [Streptomyces pseudovenezuelae]
MSTDYQQAREALGARLRELRTEAGLNGKEFAERIGWQRSKVSRLENGKQTASDTDVEAWVDAAEQPDEADELRRRLRSLETAHRSWRRQLSAGHRVVQEGHLVQEQQAQTVHIFEVGIIPGIFQTADYARGVLTDVSNRLGTSRDIEEGVRARMKRQAAVYEPGHHFNVLIWEAALHVVRCAPEAMAAQLSKLGGFIGLDTVTLGIIPLGARTPFSPKHGFWIIDERLVVADTWNAELSLDSQDDVAVYRNIWELMRESAVYDHQAHGLIARARASHTLS